MNIKSKREYTGRTEKFANVVEWVKACIEAVAVTLVSAGLYKMLISYAGREFSVVQFTTASGVTLSTVMLFKMYDEYRETKKEKEIKQREDKQREEKQNVCKTY